MTPTRSQLDAALPRVPAGISAMCGNLTKPDGRAVALDWLEALIGRAYGGQAELIALAVEIAADTRLTDLYEYSSGGMSAIDLHRALDELHEELQRCDSGLCEPESDEQGSDAQSGTWTPHRTYSTVLTYNPIKLTASNDWPPPRKGTHESDLSAARICRLAPRDTPLSTHPDPDIYLTARDWSRSL